MAFILSEVYCHPEDVHKVRALVHAQFSTHRMASGWRGCRIGFDLFTPARLVLFEKWTSAAAFHRHLHTGRAMTFIDAMQGLMVTPTMPRLVQTAAEVSASEDVVYATATDFLIYQARCRGADTGEAREAREALCAIDALFRICPGFLASSLAEDIFEAGCFFGMVEWQNPHDAAVATVEPELLRLTVAAAPLFRNPLRFRLLNAVSVESVNPPGRLLGESLIDLA